MTKFVIIPAFKKLGMNQHDSSDSDGLEDRVVEGAPMANTLETTLSIFPLAESRVARKRKRVASPTVIYTMTKTPTPAAGNNQIPPTSVEIQDTADILSDIFFPSEEDVLTDDLERSTVLDNQISFKRQKQALEEKIQKSIQFKNRINEMMSKLQPLPRKHIQSRRTKPLYHNRTPQPTDKKYNYMVPNQFNVRMVSPFTLFPYQCDTVQWMVDREEKLVTNPNYEQSRSGCLLAMVMGLGKTPCAATLVARTVNLQRIERSCTLYVCPKNLLGTVRHEFEKFFGNQLRVLIYHADFLRSQYRDFTEIDIRCYDVLITNYSTLTARTNTAAPAMVYDKVLTSKQLEHRSARAFINFPWFRIILDESHEIRERRKRFAAACALNSSRRICLTGTPIHNNIRDLFNQLIFTGLRCPAGVKFKKQTLKQMDLMKMIKFVEYKDAIKVQLPPKRINKVYFDMSYEETYLHEHFATTAKQLFTQASENKSKRGNIVMQVHGSMIRIMQICSAAYLITPMAKVAPSDPSIASKSQVVIFPQNTQVDTWLKNRLGPAGVQSSKMKRFVQLIRELRISAPQGKLKIVVFANYVATLRLAVEALQVAQEVRSSDVPNYVEVNGSVKSSYRREELYTSFRMNPQVEFLFMTLKVGNVGLNLSEADKVIFLEPWYSYAALHQGESRVHRIGQQCPVDIYYMLASKSIEERIYSIAMTKKSIAEDVAVARDFKLGFTEMKELLYGPT